MLKKSLYLLVTIGLIQFLITACCPDPVTFYSRIIELDTQNYNGQMPVADSSRIALDDYLIELIVREETFAKATPSLGLLPSAYALNCLDEYRGLQSPISRFTITADKPILNTPAGQPLSYEHFLVYFLSFQGEPNSEAITLEEWLGVLNGNTSPTLEYYLQIQDEIETEEFLTFRISLEQADGSTFEVETGAVGFE